MTIRPLQTFLSVDRCQLYKGFDAVLEQNGEDGKRHPIAYASQQTNTEVKYALTELEIAAL